MLCDSIEDLRFTWKQTLERLKETLKEGFLDPGEESFLRGKIDAYEEVLGDL